MNDKQKYKNKTMNSSKKLNFLKSVYIVHRNWLTQHS